MEHLILPEEDEVAPPASPVTAVVLGLLLGVAVIGVIEFTRWLL